MLANRTNSQFIADKISSKQGVTCSSPSLMTGGGTYGVTNASLNADVEAGLGKARHLVLIITVTVIHKKVVLPVIIMMLIL